MEYNLTCIIMIKLINIICNYPHAYHRDSKLHNLNVKFHYVPFQSLYTKVHFASHVGPFFTYVMAKSHDRASSLTPLINGLKAMPSGQLSCLGGLCGGFQVGGHLRFGVYCKLFFFYVFLFFLSFSYYYDPSLGLITKVKA